MMTIHNVATISECTYNESFTTQAEPKSFLLSALAWKGTVSPQILPRVTFVTIYSLCVYLIEHFWQVVSWPITPFEYSGAVLTLLLVLRVNAGQDRWWEARKLWGSIVNQSRNLALVILGYSQNQPDEVASALKWIAIWPHVMRESLRNQTTLKDVERILGPEDTAKIRSSRNMSMYVSLQIERILSKLHQEGLNSFAFLRAESERSKLIDAIGACERIKNTQIPYALAIKVRRFIAMFLLLMPIALVDAAGWLTPFIVALISYPLFSLDEIGVELQHPFSPNNLSHLPLDQICTTIESNVMSLLPEIPRGENS